MLLTKHELEAIRMGTISVVFRRWRRPSVKSGGTLLTAIGQLSIDRVEMLDATTLRPIDARKAGFASLPELIHALGDREGDLYRIQLSYAGADPRIALREMDSLSPAEVNDLCMRLARLDNASSVGPWTSKVLHTIQVHPFMPAVDLAAHTGFAKEWLKLNVRKLKNLGLTISHHPGYELSPRGRAILEHIDRKA
ncbi:MAG: hypothetical protein KF905_07320 [Flavobacteriales bacterium]|nr:hypothetical protein [Flavobacteriales bacterium]